jgi:hypothetical protein
MMKHLETQKFLDHKQSVGMQKAAVKRLHFLPLFCTLLHCIRIFAFGNLFTELFSMKSMT